MMPRSFDAVGTIAIVEVPRSLAGYEKAIAKSIMQRNKHVKTVVKKIGGHEGKYRVQKLKHIGGERTTCTAHTESSIRMEIDVARCYFSPRLSSERLRIAKQVRPRERVLVMFAGVGPYALVISKLTKAADVVAVEANPEAVKYAKKNVALNKLANVSVVRGDVKTRVPGLGKFDRIIMPLPKDASSYLKTALFAAKKKAMLHFYTFAPEDGFVKAGKEFAEKCRAFGYDCRVKSITKCGQQKPRVWRICIDALAKH